MNLNKKTIDFNFIFIYKKQSIIEILLQIKKKVNQHIYGFTENIKRSNLKMLSSEAI